MPILNPSVQKHLLNIETSEILNVCYNFYYKYLKIASHYIYHDFSTIETSIQFKQDLLQIIPLINNKFNCHLNKIDFNNPSITNFYKYLINHLNTNDKQSDELDGSYFKQILSNDYEINFFKPNIYFSSYH